MKRKVFTIALALLTAASAWAYDFKSGDLYYNITNASNKTVEVTYEYQWSSDNYSSLSGVVSIPETVSYNSTIYGVTSIGSYAFYYCYTLTQVTIPNSVTYIGWSAFQNCYALAQVNIPGCVTSIGDYAFCSCDALTQITIPNTVTSIGIGAFYYSGLTTANIGNGVTTIGEEAFQDCSSLATVSIGSGLTTIGNNAFYACWALTQFNVDEANEAYCSDGGVLFNKDKTTLLQYPAGKTETTYAVPTGVTSIAKYAFAGSNALTEVTLPEGLTDIAEYAFAWCRNLTKISLPESLESIGNVAFNECTGLTEMTVLATTPPTLGTDVFLNVSRTIPVYVPATPPAVTGNTFDGVSRDIPVLVPAASLAAYQASVWKGFTNLQAITTAIHTPSMPESISMQGGMLHNPQQLHLTLYDMQGRQVYSGNDNTVSQPAGVYVLRCAGASGKVLF